MNSARAGLTAKRPVVSEDETARWKVTPGRRPAAEAKDHGRAPAPGSQPGAARARRAGLRLVVARTLATENASTRVLTRCGFTRTAELADPDEGPVWLCELRLWP